MQQTFTSVRNQMSVFLENLNNQAVQQVTVALQRVIDINNITGSEIERLPEEDICSQNLRQEWTDVLEEVGEDLTECTRTDMDEVYLAVGQVHEFIQNHTLIAFEVQNLVLNAFIQINPVTQA